MCCRCAMRVGTTGLLSRRRENRGVRGYDQGVGSPQSAVRHQMSGDPGLSGRVWGSITVLPGERHSMNIRIPQNLSQEIDDLEKTIAAHARGEVSDVELKARRVPFGVYEQRARGRYMARIRCTAGIIAPAQLRRVAELARIHGSGVVHVTTRQELQIHDLPIEHIVPVIRDLFTVGLTTRGGGGNTVRNITASWDSGIAPDEVFDVTPHAVELTSRLIARADSWLLPRKFKVSFSNSPIDSAMASVNDVGFVATVKDGQRGFKVFVAGGLGRMPQTGHVLHEFVPECDVFVVAEAAKRVFSRFGNRKNKHTARLRFLWNSLGRERFVSLYEGERRGLAGEPAFELPVVEPGLSRIPGVPPVNDPDFAVWERRYVQPQKESGRFSVLIPVALGVLTSEQVQRIANFAATIGDDVVRLTLNQNVSLRNISAASLAGACAVARSVTELWDKPAFIGNAVACAGSDTCQLGICRARGALSAVAAHLSRSSTVLDAVGGIRLHISGCPNTCGQHMTADLGFYGKVERHESRSYPAYAIVAGGSVSGTHGARLAERVDEIPARHLPQLVERILRAYAQQRPKYSDFAAFVSGEGRLEMQGICDTYRQAPSFEQDPEFYHDWGASEPFSTEGRGTGECAAGLFDLIDVDFGKIRADRAALSAPGTIDNRQELVERLAITSARALLISKGVEAGSTGEILVAFEREFIEAGLVPEKFRTVVRAARSDTGQLALMQDEVVALSRAVEALYASLDETLTLHPVAVDATAIVADMQKDFRGVACPMNFVKTKMALAGLRAGQTLAVLLDDGAPIENDRTAEADAVKSYNSGILLAVQLGDNGSRELMESILKDEEAHIDWIEAQIGQIHQLGVQNYLAEQVG